MMREYLLTSESVSPGHPDKVADQISDGILDAILAADSRCRVACETLVKSDLVLLAGEITTDAWPDLEGVVRQVIREAGYTDPSIGFSADTCAVVTAITRQSPDIAIGVNSDANKKQGAGDQGIMVGYACRETPVLMPAPILYAHRLMQRQSQLYRSGALPWLLPDGKSQVTLRYMDGKVIAADTIVVSTQHRADVSREELEAGVINQIIRPVFPSEWLNGRTRYFVNPTGRFVKGGPPADCGLTGRKTMVDTYGSLATHGGGGFSGKDPSKVDRTAAYALRHIAKNVVHAGLADRCEIQIAYAIGIADPLALTVNTFGTGRVADAKIENTIRMKIDLTPAGMIQRLDLLRPLYRKTAVFGHFGREEPEFTWERTDLSEAMSGLL